MANGTVSKACAVNTFVNTPLKTSKTTMFMHITKRYHMKKRGKLDINNFLNALPKVTKLKITPHP